MPSVIPTLRYIASHPLSSKRRVSAFWRFAKWQIESRLREEVVVDWVAGARLIACNGMTGATGNIYCGLHEFVEMGFLLHLLRPEDLFVDVGANAGSYTVLASAVCKAQTIAVEPDPISVKALIRNVKINAIESRVQVEQVALGERSGRAYLTAGRDTTNQIVSQRSSATQEIQMRRLDDVVSGKSPMLIKMDVEGHERQVIDGGRNALRDSSLLAIQLETVNQEVQEDLRRLDFRKMVYNPFSRQLSFSETGAIPGCLNTIFVRDVELCRARTESAPTRQVFNQAI